MAALTKAELARQLEAAHVSYQVLEAQCNTLRSENARLRDHVAAKRYVRPTPTPVQLIAHDEYARTLVTAREMAIRTGRCVRVTSAD
jgi:hypothetical protein